MGLLRLDETALKVQTAVGLLRLGPIAVCCASSSYTAGGEISLWYSSLLVFMTVPLADMPRSWGILLLAEVFVGGSGGGIDGGSAGWW